MKDEIGNLKPEKTDLKARTRELSLAFIQLYVALPKTTEAQILGKQVLRSATSVGAHYRESQRAKSDADFIHKIERALQEAEESLYWLELLEGSGILHSSQVAELNQELDEIVRIFVAMVCKVKARTGR